MDDKELLAAAIAASGKSMRAFRKDVLGGYPKNVQNLQRWLAGTNDVPIAVRETCVQYLTEQLATVPRSPAPALDVREGPVHTQLRDVTQEYHVRRATTLSLAEAEQASGISATTLRVQLNRGRLVGEKRGGSWFVTESELERYLASRSPRGRRSPREVEQK